MFTSRAEYRLRLRADNADQRLTGIGIAYGLVGAERAALFHVKQNALDTGISQLNCLSLTPNEAESHGITIKKDGRRRSAFELLSFKDVSFDHIARIWPSLFEISKETARQIEIEARYAVYLERQQADIESLRKDEALKIPSDFDYEMIAGLSTELKGKLERHAPETLAQAGRIDGMTPAALMLLLAHIKRASQQRKAG
jgi:tRNA uridine 5-carboxymethylaminomethyl modification enzyme